MTRAFPFLILLACLCGCASPVYAPWPPTHAPTVIDPRRLVSAAVVPSPNRPQALQTSVVLPPPMRTIQLVDIPGTNKITDWLSLPCAKNWAVVARASVDLTNWPVLFLPTLSPSNTFQIPLTNSRQFFRVELATNPPAQPGSTNL